MSANQASFVENSNSCRSFTISQLAPGARLQYDPPLHSKELAEAIHNYIPGPFTLQEKQRQLSLEFFQWRNTTCPEGPASYYHDAEAVIEFSSFSSADSSFDQPAPSLSRESSSGNNEVVTAKPAAARRSKVVKKSAVAKPASSGPRLPGFSIMTKDGVDITDLAPRGPKTKEQREHAAMMRKLRACPTCKKRKQRCNPSHHAQMSRSSSSASAKMSSPMSSTMESQAPTPSSSVASGNSPFEGHSQDMQIAQAGQHFGGMFPSPNMDLNPSDLSPFSAFDINNSFTLNMGMDTIDPSMFDSNMFSAGFEPTPEEPIEETFFDFSSWDPYHGGSDGSMFSNVSSQRNNGAGTALANSSQSFAHAATTSALPAGGQFLDFVPAWGSGSTPYVPVDGSPLQSQEEFGVQSDFSRAVSRGSQGEDRSLPGSGSQFQRPETQLDSLFGEDSFSSISSAEMTTPSSTESGSSRRGFFPSETGSVSVTHHMPPDSYPTHPHDSTNPPRTEIPQGMQGMQNKQYLAMLNRRYPMSSASNSLESHTGVSTAYAQDGDIVSGSDRQQASLQCGPQSTNLAHARVSSGAEQRRMTPVIQSSWGPYLDGPLGSQQSSTASTFVHLTEDELQNYKSQLLQMNDRNTRKCLPRQHSRDVGLSSRTVIPHEQQCSNLDVIPQTSNRPFRFSPTEDSSSFDAGFNSTPVIYHEQSNGLGDRQLHRDTSKDASRDPRDPMLVARTSSSESNVSRGLDNRLERRLLDKEVPRQAATDVLSLPWHSQLKEHSCGETMSRELRREATPVDIRLTVEQSAIITSQERSSPSQNSQLVVTQQQSLQSDVSRDTRLQGTSLGLVALLVLTCYIFVASLLGYAPIGLLSSAVIPVLLYRQAIFSTDKQTTPELEATSKQANRLPSGLRSVLFGSVPKLSIYSSSTTMSRRSNGHCFRSVLSSRVLI